MQKNNKYEIKSLDWDTNFFNVKSAKLILNDTINETEIYQIIKKMQNENYEFITVSNINNDNNNNYILRNIKEIFLADINIQFEKEVERKIVDDVCPIIKNNFKYNDDIVKISEDSFIYSRFINDPRLHEASKVYVEWAKNSFNKKDKYYCVYKNKNKILGYLLFSLANNCLIIELIAVSNVNKGNGIGTKLINKVEEFAYLNDINKIRVGTQVNNIYAQNFYINNGFRHVSNNSIYHLWLKA